MCVPGKDPSSKSTLASPMKKGGPVGPEACPKSCGQQKPNTSPSASLAAASPPSLSPHDQRHRLTAGAPPTSCRGGPFKSPVMNTLPMLLESWGSLGQLILGLLEFSASLLFPAPAGLSSKDPQTRLPPTKSVKDVPMLSSKLTDRHRWGGQRQTHFRNVMYISKVNQLKLGDKYKYAGIHYTIPLLGLNFPVS